MDPTQKPNDSAFSGTIEQAVEFSPNGIWRTFQAVNLSGGVNLFVYRSGKIISQFRPNEPDKAMVEAIAKQNWSKLLHPIKYMATTWSVMGLLGWAAEYARGRHVEREEFSFFNPTVLLCLFIFFCGALPLHFFLNIIRTNVKNRISILDGTVKLMQIMMYISGNVIIIYSPIIIRATSFSDAQFEPYSSIFCVLMILIAFLFFAVPLLASFLCVAGMLYGVSPFRVFVCILLVNAFLSKLYERIAMGTPQ